MLRIFSAVTLLISSAAANAGWQSTQWDMTPSQVAAAMKGKAPVGAGETEEQGATWTIGNAGTYTSGDHIFRSLFYYRDNRLYKVRLEQKSGACAGLRQDLESTYGLAFKSDDRGLLVRTTWQDRKKNNLVELESVGRDYCLLNYSPLRSKQNSGL